MNTKLLIICAIFLASIASTLIYQSHYEAQQDANRRMASAITLGEACASPCPFPPMDIPAYQPRQKR
jgi:hypothetical protein